MLLLGLQLLLLAIVTYSYHWQQREDRGALSLVESMIFKRRAFLLILATTI
jgi:hypothetical protein